MLKENVPKKSLAEIEELSKLVGKLFIANGKPMQAGTPEVWIPLLEEWDIVLLRVAFKKCMTTGDGWPTLARIIDAAKEEKVRPRTPAEIKYEKDIRYAKEFLRTPEGIANMPEDLKPLAEKILREQGAKNAITN